MSNSPLVNYVKLSPNCSKPRNHKIDKITIHHMAGNLTVEQCGNVFASTKAQASANYGVGTDGRVGMYVEEANRAWTSANRDNDNRAITIEVANDEIGGNWHVSDKALETTIKLCVDICERNLIGKLTFTGNSDGNLTMHKYFAATTCPGPYLESKFSYIAQEVNRRLMENLNKEIELVKESSTIKETPVVEETPVLTPPPVPAPAPVKDSSFKVRVTSSALNVRKGPSIAFPINTIIRDKGVYTIVEASGSWGKLKSGAGWISLNYTTKI